MTREPAGALVLFIASVALWILGWYSLGRAKRVLAQASEERRRALEMRNDACARSAEISRELARYAEHAKAFEQYEFGSGMRASAILRERERAS